MTRLSHRVPCSTGAGGGQGQISSGNRLLDGGVSGCPLSQRRCFPAPAVAERRSSPFKSMAAWPGGAVRRRERRLAGPSLVHHARRSPPQISLSPPPPQSPASTVAGYQATGACDDVIKRDRYGSISTDGERGGFRRISTGPGVTMDTRSRRPVISLAWKETHLERFGVRTSHTLTLTRP